MENWQLITGLIIAGGVMFGAIWKIFDGRLTKLEQDQEKKVSQDQHREFVGRFDQHRLEGGGRVTRAEFDRWIAERNRVK